MRFYEAMGEYTIINVLLSILVKIYLGNNANNLFSILYILLN